MRLTVLQLSKFRSIQERIRIFSQELDKNIMKEPLVKIFESEMNENKVILENMFADTDSKDEKISILLHLIRIGGLMLISNTYKPLNAVNDYCRHAEIAFKIEPKDPLIIIREEHDCLT